MLSRRDTVLKRHNIQFVKTPDLLAAILCLIMYQDTLPEIIDSSACFCSTLVMLLRSIPFDSAYVSNWSLIALAVTLGIQPWLQIVIEGCSISLIGFPMESYECKNYPCQRQIISRHTV